MGGETMTETMTETGTATMTATMTVPAKIEAGVAHELRLMVTVPLASFCLYCGSEMTDKSQMICSLTVSEETEVSNGSEMTDHLFAKCPDSVSEETEAGERSGQYTCHTGDLFAKCLRSVSIVALRRQELVVALR